MAKMTHVHVYKNWMLNTLAFNCGMFATASHLSDLKSHDEGPEIPLGWHAGQCHHRTNNMQLSLDGEYPAWPTYSMYDLRTITVHGAVHFGGQCKLHTNHGLKMKQIVVMKLKLHFPSYVTPTPPDVASAAFPHTTVRVPPRRQPLQLLSSLKYQLRF